MIFTSSNNPVVPNSNTRDSTLIPDRTNVVCYSTEHLTLLVRPNEQIYLSNLIWVYCRTAVCTHLFIVCTKCSVIYKGAKAPTTFKCISSVKLYVNLKSRSSHNCFFFRHTSVESLSPKLFRGCIWHAS